MYRNTNNEHIGDTLFRLYSFLSGFVYKQTYVEFNYVPQSELSIRHGTAHYSAFARRLFQFASAGWCILWLCQFHVISFWYKTHARSIHAQFSLRLRSVTIRQQRTIYYNIP